MGFPSLYNGSFTNGEGIRNSRYLLGHATNRDTVGLGGIVLRQSRNGGNFEVMDSADGYVLPSNFVRVAVARGAVYGFTFEDRSVTHKAAPAAPPFNPQAPTGVRRGRERGVRAGRSWG